MFNLLDAHFSIENEKDCIAMDGGIEELSLFALKERKINEERLE